MSSPLPNFERPPVNEVVLAVTFDAPPQLKTTDLLFFWRTVLRGELPNLEEQGPFLPIIESAGPQEGPPVNLELLGAPPPPRLWARSTDGTRLLQLQPGWIAFNWRDTPESSRPYPRWPTVEREFWRYFELFVRFLSDEGICASTPPITQCEVTYINRIDAGDAWQTHGDMDKVLNIVAAPHEFLPRPETEQVSLAFSMHEEGSGDRGRLHVVVQPAFLRADNAPVILLTLTARGRPPSADEEGARQFFGRGHEWVVRGFAAITTEGMHRVWGRLPDA
jgi:uncharacterized protein (TIGR04255 family)